MPNIKTLHNLQLQIFPSHDIKYLLNSDKVLEFFMSSVERTTVNSLCHHKDKWQFTSVTNFNKLEAEQDLMNNRRCIVHHIALIKNSPTYSTEAITIEKTLRVNIKSGHIPTTIYSLCT